MLQIDHVYEFLYQELFKEFECWYLPSGVPKTGNLTITDISVFTQSKGCELKIFFYDQEPFLKNLVDPYIKMYEWVKQYSLEEIINLYKINQLPYGILADLKDLEFYLNNHQCIYKKCVLVTR